jgi:hypothetical protein
MGDESSPEKIIQSFFEAANEKGTNMAFIDLQATSNEPLGIKPPALVLLEVLVPECVFLSPTERREVDPIRVGIGHGSSNMIAIIGEIGWLMLCEIVADILLELIHGSAIDGDGIYLLHVIWTSTLTHTKSYFPLSYRC